MKTLKYITAFIIVGLIGFGLFVFVINYAPDFARRKLTEFISEKTDNKLSFSNLKIILRPFPWLKINHPEYRDGENTFLAKTVTINPSLAELFSGKISINEIVLHSPEFRISEKEPEEKKKTDIITAIGKKEDLDNTQKEEPSLKSFSIGEIRALNLKIMQDDKSLIVPRVQLGLSIGTQEIKVSNLSINLPVISNSLFHSKNILYNLETGVLKVPEATLSTGSTKVDFSKIETSESGDFSGHISTREFLTEDLEEILKTLKAGTPPLKNWDNFSFNLTVNKTGAKIKASGSINLKNMTTEGSSLSELTLKNIEAQLLNNTLSSLKSDLDLTGLHIKDGVDKFAVKRLTGPFQLSFSTGIKPETILNSSLNIEGFAFEDKETKIHNVNARLTGINARISNSTKVQLTLKSNSYSMENPDITISSAESIQAPLTVTVPASGGYLIEGPVSVKNIVMNTAARDMAPSGKVTISVGNKKHTYVADTLNTIINSVPLSVKTTVNYQPGIVSVKDSAIRFTKLKKSLVSVDLETKTGTNSKFKGKISIANSPLQSILKLYKEDIKEEYQGNIKSFKFSFSGDKKDLLPTIKANGSLLIESGKIKNRRIAHNLMDAAKSVPGISHIRGDLAENSEIRRISSNFAVGEEKFTFSDLRVDKATYFLSGSGSIGFDKGIRANISTVFLQESFDMMALGIEPLASIFSELGKVEIPFKVKGTLDEPEFKPDYYELTVKNKGISLIDSAVSGTARRVKGVGRALNPWSKKKEKSDDDEK